MPPKLANQQRPARQPTGQASLDVAYGVGEGPDRGRAGVGEPETASAVAAKAAEPETCATNPGKPHLGDGRQQDRHGQDIDNRQ